MFKKKINQFIDSPYIFVGMFLAQAIAMVLTVFIVELIQWYFDINLHNYFGRA